MDALAVFQRLGQGKLLEDLNQAIVRTSGEVVAVRKPGTVTLTLKISPAQNEGTMVAIEETISRKAPAKDARGAYLYVGDGQMHKEDPLQTRMEFREVDKDGVLREVQDTRAEREVS